MTSQSHWGWVSHHIDQPGISAAIDMGNHHTLKTRLEVWSLLSPIKPWSGYAPIYKKGTSMCELVRCPQLSYHQHLMFHRNPCWERSCSSHLNKIQILFRGPCVTWWSSLGWGVRIQGHSWPRSSLLEWTVCSRVKCSGIEPKQICIPWGLHRSIRNKEHYLPSTKF